MSNRPLTMPPFIVFLLFIGSISKNGPERIRQPFSRGASPSAETSPGENPLGHEVGISLRPIILLPDERSVVCHLSGIIGMIKYEFIPARVQNEKYLIYLYPKGYKS